MKHVHSLTTYQFLDKIHNYRQNPQWFYLGQLPSMVVFSSSSNRFCNDLESALEIIAKRHKNKYDVFLIDTLQEKELGERFTIDAFPTIYLCPVKGKPSIVKNTINIRELVRMADRILLEK